MPDKERVNHLVVIASSTGGPKSLQQVIPKLPANLDAAVIVVQHMPSGFTNSLAERLNQLSKIQVSEANDQEILKNGHVYIAKGGRHLKVQEKNGVYRIMLTDEPPREGVRPCANYAYESLTEVSAKEVVAVVLTGMGADGTEGIRHLKEKKEIYTIAQDKDSSVIYGMPKMLTEAGLVDVSLPLSKIADEITKKLGVR